MENEKNLTIYSYYIDIIYLWNITHLHIFCEINVIKSVFNDIMKLKKWRKIRFSSKCPNLFFLRRTLAILYFFYTYVKR